jgi:ABC-type phosphate/phosphonate transport system substrate-binding protein
MRALARRNRFIVLLAAAAGGLVAVASAAENEANRPGTVQIGMVNSLFRDQPEALVIGLMQPFSRFMEAQTGVPGKLITGGDAAHLGQLLAEDRVQLGVFHGVEFGWAQQKHPDIRPLMIAINQRRHLHAVVLVRADAPVEAFADLKGKALAMHLQSREHCHLFLQRCCRENGLEPEAFFAKIATPENVEDALDDLVDNVVQATVVDALALDCYQRRKPVRFAKLKTLERSEAFPAAVVAYHSGSVDEATLRRFREGMLNANKGTLGRQFLTMWKLTGFEQVPEDYEETMAIILKAYPPPADEK